jgi:hypothetical protein
LIRDASLLDAESLAQLADMAKDGDYQIWLERVDTSGQVGFYIEDGMVVAHDGEPVAPPEPKKKAKPETKPAKTETTAAKGETKAPAAETPPAERIDPTQGSLV